jgi:cytidylate kinase
MGKGNRMTEQHPPSTDRLRVITMRVSGSGKSLIGHTLAEMLGAHFLAAMTFTRHPTSKKWQRAKPLPTQTAAHGSAKSDFDWPQRKDRWSSPAAR